MTARTQPLDYWEKWEIKGFCVCFGENLEKKKECERIWPENAPKIPNFLLLLFFNSTRGKGVFIVKKWLFSFSRPFRVRLAGCCR